ncbi:unnamed protein product [Paramecium primaurelia]|uniref:Alpha/beta hydrolase fold-3 domain-containing protein n=1 Tax=Paramecium primaurelia TaxID=5886 RepID=A0A8S1LCG5_PARPR|nr:unnamed protein product [Paramecium primaurelia]
MRQVQGMNRVPSVENYDLFNKIYQKSKLAKAQQSSQDLLYDGDQYRIQQSQQMLVEYLKDLNEMIEDVVRLVDQLHSLNELEVNNLFQHLKKQLRNLKQVISSIMDVMLGKGKSPFQAQKPSHVNIVMVNTIRTYLVEVYIPNLLETAKYALDNFEGYKGTFLKDMKIASTQLIMINLIFGASVDIDKNSLFSLDKNHKDWKELYLICERKSLGDVERINQSFDNFANTILIGHAIMGKSSKFKNEILKKLQLAINSIYYQIFDAKKEAFTNMSQMKAQNAIEVMNMIETPAIKKIMAMAYPKIKVNCKIYIDPVVTPISIQWVNSQLKNGQLNKITTQQIKLINEELHLDPNAKFILHKFDPQKLRIRILCNSSIDDTSSSWFSNSQQHILHDTILVHIHGGGFIAHSSSSHQSYTREWAIKLGIPIFSIDYSLAPKYPYPQGLDDVWQAYNWILIYCYKHFDIQPKRIIVAGDSAGGNLACALTGLAIKMGQRVPDGLFMAYPALDLRFNFTPSYLHALTDKIISHTILGICVESYASNPLTQLSSDPFINPMLLSDEILAKFPPTRLMCGTKDPLHDNTWAFASRLLKVKKNVQFIIYEQICHGFLCYKTIKGMQEIQVCIDDAIKYIQELINLSKS